MDLIFQLQVDAYHCDAAYDILTCMNEGCCPEHHKGTFPMRNIDNLRDNLGGNAPSKESPRPVLENFNCVGMNSEGKLRYIYEEMAAREYEDFLEEEAEWPSTPVFQSTTEPPTTPSSTPSPTPTPTPTSPPSTTEEERRA